MILTKLLSLMICGNETVHDATKFWGSFNEGDVLHSVLGKGNVDSVLKEDDLILMLLYPWSRKK